MIEVTVEFFFSPLDLRYSINVEIVNYNSIMALEKHEMCRKFETFTSVPFKYTGKCGSISCSGLMFREKRC